MEEDFDDTAAGRFAARSMMNVNQFYSENMAEDIKRGLYDNAANCMVANGHLPYGYKADETLHYAIDEPKVRLSGRYSLAFPAVRLSLISRPA